MKTDSISHPVFINRSASFCMLHYGNIKDHRIIYHRQQMSEACSLHPVHLLHLPALENLFQNLSGLRGCCPAIQREDTVQLYKRSELIKGSEFQE